MKHILLILFTLSFLTAQDFQTGFGLRALGNYNLMSEADGLDSEMGYGFGISYLTHIGNDAGTIFNITAEFTARRVSEDLDDYYKGLTIIYSFNYLTVRPLFLVPVSETTFFIAGGNFAFEAGSEITATAGSESETTDLDDGLNTTRFGLEAGFGFTLERVLLTFTYDLGLNKVLDRADSESKLSSMNVAFTLML